MRGMRSSLLVFALVVVLVAAATAATGKAGSVVTAKPDLQWLDGGFPGVTFASLEGDRAQGPSHFFLKYGAGFVAPLHHHTADHYVTTISGTLVLIVDGKENRLSPGSYFALTGAAPHGARCDGAEDCVMFIDARGAWDVVPEPPAKH